MTDAVLCSDGISIYKSIGFLQSGFIGVDLVLKVALVKGSVHDEILSSVVGKHYNESAQICLDFVEFQKSEQIVRNSEKHYADQYEKERGSA